LLKREMAILIQRELGDARARGVTLTAVEVARDLSSAKVYLTCPGGAQEARQTVPMLNKAAGYLRRRLKERLVLRYIPELRFLFDESLERGVRISRLIEQAQEDDETGAHD